MNIKGKLRLEVQKELDKLEMTCGDMTSLLRGLEIHVGGGFCPSANEVSYFPCHLLCLLFQFSFVGKKNIALCS